MLVRVAHLELSYIAGGDVSARASLENSLTISYKVKKLNIHLPYDPAIPPLGIYPRGIKAYVHVKIYIWMLIIALLITAQS